MTSGAAFDVVVVKINTQDGGSTCSPDDSELSQCDLRAAQSTQKQEPTHMMWRKHAPASSSHTALVP